MLTLKPHQVKAVEEMHNGCILRGGVGSGKTIASLAYYITKECGGVIGDRDSLVNFPDLYVITTAKKRNSLEWEEDALKFLLSVDRDLSVGGLGFTVDSWNNINKYKDVKDAFFIFDEQKLVGSGAWTKAFIAIAKANRWVLLTATPADTWMDYISVFVANGFYKNRTDFIRTHVVYNTFTKFPKVDRYVEVRRLIECRDAILVNMPFERHTVRHTKDVLVDHDEEMVRRASIDRWHVFEERPLRDVAELFLVMRKIVNRDPSRIRAIRRLLLDHPRMVIFYNYNYELEILRGLSRDGDFTVREWNGHRHDPLPQGERWVYLVQYTAGSEGWNCTTTDTVVFYSLTYSYKQFEQAKGRIDRLNTPYTDLWYYVLKSKSWIDQAIWKALMAKKSFNKASYADIWS